MASPLCCPFCAFEHPEFVSAQRGVVMQCPECGASGPLAGAGERSHALHLWNQRFGNDEFAAVAELELLGPQLH